jgi:hypothetical protein
VPLILSLIGTPLIFLTTGDFAIMATIVTLPNNIWLTLGIFIGQSLAMFVARISLSLI